MKICTIRTCENLGKECLDHAYVSKKPKKPLSKVSKKSLIKPKRIKLVPVPKLKEKAQKVCNEYIRLRDKNKPCISCGSDKADQAGHYISVRQSSYLRYNEKNIARQCSGCNCYLHGNQVFYRRELVKRIGELEVEILEKECIENRLYKWSRTELEEIISYYNEKIKQLK